jgi:hypothetical protein
LQDALLSALVTCLTNVMTWLGALGVGLQRHGERSGSNGLELIALLLGRPRFKASSLRFTMAYSINQRRLRRIGLYCAGLGGHNLALEFDELGRALAIASQPGQSLDNVPTQIGARQALARSRRSRRSSFSSLVTIAEVSSLRKKMSIDFGILAVCATGSRAFRLVPADRHAKCYAIINYV